MINVVCHLQSSIFIFHEVQICYVIDDDFKSYIVKNWHKFLFKSHDKLIIAKDVVA